MNLMYFKNLRGDRDGGTTGLLSSSRRVTAGFDGGGLSSSGPSYSGVRGLGVGAGGSGGGGGSRSWFNAATSGGGGSGVGGAYSLSSSRGPGSGPGTSAAAATGAGGGGGSGGMHEMQHHHLRTHPLGLFDLGTTTSGRHAAGDYDDPDRGSGGSRNSTSAYSAAATGSNSNSRWSQAQYHGEPSRTRDRDHQQAASRADYRYTRVDRQQQQPSASRAVVDSGDVLPAGGSRSVRSGLYDTEGKTAKRVPKGDPPRPACQGHGSISKLMSRIGLCSHSVSERVGTGQRPRNYGQWPDGQAGQLWPAQSGCEWRCEWNNGTGALDPRLVRQAIAGLVVRFRQQGKQRERIWGAHGGGGGRDGRQQPINSAPLVHRGQQTTQSRAPPLRICAERPAEFSGRFRRRPKTPNDLLFVFLSPAAAARNQFVSAGQQQSATRPAGWRSSGSSGPLQQRPIVRPAHRSQGPQSQRNCSRLFHHPGASRQPLHAHRGDGTYALLPARPSSSFSSNRSRRCNYTEARPPVLPRGSGGRQVGAFISSRHSLHNELDPRRSSVPRLDSRPN